MKIVSASSKQTRLGLGCGALFAAIVMTGCASGKSVQPTAPTSTSVIVTTTSVSPVDAAILDGYRQYRATYAADTDPMNPTDPALAQHATGQLLVQLHSSFLARESAGQVFRGAIDSAPKVINVNGSQATIFDCYFDHSQVVDLGTGKAEGTPDTERQLVDVTMQLEDGSWRASLIVHKGSGCSAS